MRTRAQLAAFAAVALFGACGDGTSGVISCGPGQRCPLGPTSYCDPNALTCVAPPYDGACNDLTPCPDSAPPICDVDVCVGCIGDDDCPNDAPICQPTTRSCGTCQDAPDPDGLCASRDPGLPRCSPAGACVECLAAADCSVDEPICRPTLECAACLKHTDCKSGYCEVDGSCGATEALIFVDGVSGADGPSCGAQTSPCATIRAGIARVTEARRTVLVQAGTYVEAAAAVGSASVEITDLSIRIEGLGLVYWRPEIAAEGSGILVQGSATVEFVELTIEPESDAGSAAVLVCAGSAPEATRLHMDNSKILRGDGAGVSADSCTLDSRNSAVSYHGGYGIIATGSRLIIERNVVSGNADGGISATSSQVLIERNKIRDNPGGGVILADCAADLRNNYIVTNGLSGPSGSAVGGVKVLGANTVGDRFEFNTIVDNFAAGSAEARGIAVEPSGSACSSNIVRGGAGATAGAVVAGSCSWSFSNIEGGIAGEGNIDMETSFANPLDGDYSLASDSPEVDAADPASAVDIDFDGDKRPMGSAPDIGADETH